MSSRKQYAIKRQTKPNSKLSEKSKNEEIKSNDNQDTIASKLGITEKSKAKESENLKLKNKTISSKQLQSDRSSRSPNSTSSLNSVKKPSTSTFNKKQSSDTPVSNRVQKTQFFPTKQMYTNVVKAAQELSKNKEHTQTKTSSRIENKPVRKETKVTSTGNVTNRPQTATIKKAPPVQPHLEEYDDDFDSYESDFEEYTSSTKTTDTLSETSLSEEEDNELETKSREIDEERKLDSGNFDLQEIKHTQVLDEIKENETEVAYIESNRSNLTSLSDEGFEDGKMDKTGQFCNFLQAQQKQNHLKSLTVKHKRGEELAGMIKLDGQTFTIFEMESTPYNVFIKKFGNNNTIQISTQTGDDNVSTEIQTEETEMVNKWTQCPIQLSEVKKNNINLNIYRQEALGVGNDYIQTHLHEVKYNEYSLKQFLESVGDTILSLIEETSQQRNCKEIDINSNRIPFSEGYISFNTKHSHLKGIPVTYANFSSGTTKLITIHNNNACSFLCTWRISDPDKPEYCIKIHGNLTSCALLGVHIYGGLNDGTIAIWNLQEQCTYVSEKITPPTYITNIDAGHTSKIVSIELFESDEYNSTDGTCNSQVYSLDEDGYLIVWTVIMLDSIIMKQVTLQQSLKYSCNKLYPNLRNLQCTNMAVNRLDVNHIFISTNYGQIIHLVTATGTKANPTKYSAGWKVQSNCVTICPFSPFYVLAAYENGKMVLFSRSSETPLITLTNCDDDICENGVEFIEWSKNKPCVLYAKDRKNCIHIWDLGLSDIFPVCSIPFKEEINFIKLSPSITKDENVTRSYMVIISNRFNVNLHVLNKDHGQQDPTEYESNVKKFLNYVNRL